MIVTPTLAAMLSLAAVEAPPLYDVDQSVCVSGDYGMCVGYEALVSDVSVPRRLYMSELERRIMAKADTCPRGKRRNRVSESVLLELLRMEEDAGLPHSLRGFTLAVGCSESGYNPKARGDRRFSKSGKRALAYGFVQMWPWWEEKYGINRTNPHEAVRTYLMRMKDQTKAAEKWCGLDPGSEKAWVVAQARAARGKIGPRYARKLLALPAAQRRTIQAAWGLNLSEGMEGLRGQNALAKKVGRSVLPQSAVRWAERCFDRTKHYTRRLKDWRKSWKGSPHYLSMVFG